MENYTKFVFQHLFVLAINLLGQIKKIKLPIHENMLIYSVNNNRYFLLEVGVLNAKKSFSNTLEEFMELILYADGKQLFWAFSKIFILNFHKNKRNCRSR